MTMQKNILGYYVDGRASLVYGTHTHVQTADERIMGNLAYISDVGMCGVYESVIGRDIDEMIANIIEGEMTKYTVASGEAVLCACVIEIDDETKKAIDIKRIQIRPY